MIIAITSVVAIAVMIAFIWASGPRTSQNLSKDEELFERLLGDLNQLGRMLHQFIRGVEARHQVLHDGDAGYMASEENS